ncbi:hypothetical protein ASG59_18695 [Methylobacterium sp. Leaf466]|nr:hypothetical protein ASG59_18695 [Methylobacterium sp. Leaf466]
MVHLNKAWSEASNAYDKSQANPYLGNFVAAPNANQFAGFQNAIDWSTGAARNTANTMGGAGAGQLAAGTAGQTAALNGLQTAAGTDYTQSNIDRANQYASGQNVSAIVDAGMYDARRQASESTLPSLYRNAAGSGNLNSDRTALAEGVVNRGLAEQAQNLSATTRANLFTQGLTMAQAQNSQQLGALAAAGSLGSTVAGQGYTGTQAGFDNTGKALTAQQAAGMGLQGLDQSVLDNDLKRWYAQYQQPWNNLQEYYKITGDLKGGTTHTVGTGTSETTSTPSMLSTIGQGIGMFGSLFCDRRYKTVHSGQIGTFNEIVPTYLFSYNHAPDVLHVGPMAQEVQAVRPDAVFEHDGMLHIDLTKF